MTVPVQITAQTSVANGATVLFPYNFKILDQGDLRVTGTLNGVTTVYVVDVDYTVTGVGDPSGGNVDFTPSGAPANGTTILRKRDMVFKRDVDYQTNGDLIASEVNADQDSPVMMVQQLLEQVSRALTIPEHLVGTVDASLPASESLKGLRWNAAATAVENYEISPFTAPAGASNVGFQPAGVGGVARTLQDKGRETVSAEDFGAVGDGVTDDSAALNAAITAVNATGGGYVNLSAKQYGVSTGIVLQEGVHLRGMGIGVTELVLTGSPTAMIDALGPELDTGIALTANAVKGAKTLTMASTAGLAIGDYLLLKDEFSYSAQSPPYRAGEVVRIQTVDSGTQVTLWSPVSGSMHAASGFAYTTANGAIAQKINFINGCGVSDLTITGELDTITIMVRMRYVYAPVIKNVLFRQGGSDGARLILCAEGVIEGLICEDLTDDIPGGHSGYAIHLAEACDGIAISNCHFTRCRHGVTTGGGNGTGIPHRVAVSNCTGHHTTQAPFDTHEAGDGITFSGCISVGSGTHGISIRSVNTHVSDCQVLAPAGGHGITVSENQARNVSIRDCVIRDVLSSGNHGINVSAFVDGMSIQGCHLENLATDGISIHSSSKNVTITDNTIKDFGMVAASRFGIIAPTGGSAERWLIARNFIRADAGSADYGIFANNLAGNSWIVDNKAFGTFATAAFSTATNVSFRNDHFGLAIVTAAQITANQNNYAPAGYIASTDLMRISSDAARSITGLGGGRDRRVVTLMNTGAFTITLDHDVTSTAANRFLCPGSVGFPVLANGTVQLIYDGTSSRWRVMG